MNNSINTLLSDVYIQKKFLKNSVLNTVIIYKYIVKDYFKYFPGKLSPLSRYEFWCFIFAFFGTAAILSSLLYFIYTLIPSYKLYCDIILYAYVLFAFNVSVRAFACRIISVQQYLLKISSNTKHNKTSYIENIIKKIFINTKTYFISAYLNIFVVFIYLLYRLFHDYGTFSFSIENELFVRIITFVIFIMQMSVVMYVILLLFPSNSSLEYFMEKNIKYYQFYHYYTVLSKNYMVDYFTLAASILSVISVGHLLIIGFSLSCHLIVWLALMLQSTALMFSRRYFSVVIGFINLIYGFVFIFFMFYNGLADMLYDANIIMQILDYYQISFALLFVGLFYHITFDQDILKMAAVLGCFFSALFLWEDYTAVKNIVVYDNHTVPVLFYGLVELLIFFVYLVRVANNKGYYISETQIWNGYRHYVDQIILKHIYMIIFYFCVLLAAYSAVLMSFPVIEKIIYINFVDNYILNFGHNIRKIVTLFIFLGLFLLFRCYHDMFAIFLISFIVICELYIVTYTALSNIFPAYMVYNIEYLYTAINGALCILSISLIKYSRLIAYGSFLSVVLFIISLISVFSNLSYKNTPVVFYVFFMSLFLENVLVSVGAYRKIKNIHKLSYR